MRTTAFCCSLAVLALVGCNKSPSTPTGTPTPWGFRITWPGEPTEMPPANQKPGEAWTYMGFYTDRTPGRFVMYSASAVELGKAASEMTPKQHLAAFKHAFQKDELARKEIEFGPKNLSGLDILSQRDGKLSRDLAVVSRTRVYSV